MAKKTDQTEERIVKVEEALSRTERFIEKNQKLLIYIIVGIIAVVLIYMAYKKFYLAPREEKAQSQMFMAQKYFEKDSLSKAINGDGNYTSACVLLRIFIAKRTTKITKQCC